MGIRNIFQSFQDCRITFLGIASVAMAAADCVQLSEHDC